MNREDAQILLENVGHIEIGDGTACLDGHFTPEELEAVIFLIRNPLNPDPKPDPLCPTCGGTVSAPLGPNGCPDIFHNAGAHQ